MGKNQRGWPYAKEGAGIVCDICPLFSSARKRRKIEVCRGKVGKQLEKVGKDGMHFIRIPEKAKPTATDSALTRIVHAFFRVRISGIRLLLLTLFS